MHKQFVLLFLIFTGLNIAVARAASEEDMQILDTYNRYYASIIAAELCDKNNFKNKDEEKKFQSNFLKARVVAAKILKKNKPAFTDNQIIENVKAMDVSLKTNLENFYRQNGCSHEILKSALNWFENFKKMPPMPE